MPRNSHYSSAMMDIQQLIHKNASKLNELEALLGLKFNGVKLLQQALVHSSYGFEQLAGGKNNETLEFIGDAVLDLAMSDILFHLFPDAREGELTKMRAGLVKEATLAGQARKIRLGDYLLLGKGEEASRGREKASILSSSFEALVGAIYLDSGYDIVFQFIRSQFKPLLAEKSAGLFREDAKSLLQEKLQERFNLAPTYHLDTEAGPDHEKSFTVSVKFFEQTLGTGTGSSKKTAEQQAAKNALNTIKTWWDELKIHEKSREVPIP